MLSLWNTIQRGYLRVIEPVADWLVRRRVHPNTITTIGTICTVIAGGIFATGHIMTGGWFLGLGAVASTLIAGVELVKRGLGQPIGSLTQMGTIRLGKRTDNRAADQGLRPARRSRTTSSSAPGIRSRTTRTSPPARRRARGRQAHRADQRLPPRRASR
jgi:hypothetical protein